MASLGLGLLVIRQIATEYQEFRKRSSALLLVEQVANQLDSHVSARVSLVAAPRAIHRVLVVPDGTSQIILACLETREPDVDLRIFWRRGANAEQHLPGRIVLVIGSQAGCQREPVGTVVAVDRSCAPERPDSRLDLAVSKAVFPGLVPGSGVPQSILLGMTFPLMSAGVLRLAPAAGGRIFAMLYFANSAGAVIGVDGPS